MRKFPKVLMVAALLFPTLSFGDSLVIMRHGEAKQNLTNTLNSDIEISKKFPLTPTGEIQVRDAAKALKKDHGIFGKNIRAIYASPLLRTQQTAEILARELDLKPSQIIVDDRLRENGMGRLEGHREHELDSLDPKPKGYLPKAKQLFGGETKEELDGRLKDFLKDLENFRSGHVIVITHGTPSFELLPMIDPTQSEKPQMSRGEFRVFKHDTYDPQKPSARPSLPHPSR